MEISKKMEDALNRQVNAELYSAYLYLSMSAHFEGENLKGFAHWMKEQAKEEVTHAMKIYSYVHERRGRVTLTQIAKPQASWKSPLSAFQDAYDHEKLVTKMIDNLVRIARAEKDNATESFLKWFVDEQVEEEAQTDEIVQKLRMIDKSPSALLVMDHRLGKRRGD